MTKTNLINKEKYDNAPIIKRLFAYLIDICIYAPLAFLFILSSKIYAFENNTQKSYFMIICLIIVSLFLFAYIPKKLNGQTLGKKIMGIRIKHIIEGNELSYWMYFLREYFAKIGMGILIIPMMFLYSIFVGIVKRSFPKTFMLDHLFSVRVIDVRKNIKQV
ncbi:MAG TPA: RDD family protein [Candidatus Dwaynia gallinarum]|nr:RDD family protein [Candidatus Dwaynia gallinarum]